MNIGGNTSNNSTEIIESEKGNIYSNNISINAKNKVELTNQKIEADKLEITANEINLKQGENSSKNTANEISTGLNLSYDLMSTALNMGISANYAKNSSNDIIYTDNELNVNEIKINSKKIDTEKRKEEHENHNLNIGGNIQTSNFGLNISKDGYGIGATISKEGKIENVSAKLNNEAYDLHSDLVYKENRDKLVDDIQNVIGTPKAYITAINNGNDFSKEIKNRIGDLNLRTDSVLKKEVEEKLKTLNSDNTSEENALIVKNVIDSISKVKGKEFKSIKFTNSPNFKGVAGTDKNGNLVLNVNEIDVKDTDSLINLITYESNRYTYQNEDKDNKTTKDTEINITTSKTNLNLPLIDDEEIDYGSNRYFAPAIAIPI